MAKPAATDPVAQLHALSALIEEKIRERDRLLAVVLQLEATGAAPDYSALVAVQTLTSTGLLNGHLPESAAAEVKLAWALNRRALLEKEVERDRAVEMQLLHDCADIVGSQELLAWNAQLAVHATLLAKVEASQKKLAEIDERWTRKTGGVRDLPLRAYVVQDYSDAVVAKRDELVSIAAAVMSRGDDNALSKPTEQPIWPPVRRY
jgi:hypothetical protein